MPSPVPIQGVSTWLRQIVLSELLVSCRWREDALNTSGRHHVFAPRKAGGEVQGAKGLWGCLPRQGTTRAAGTTRTSPFSCPVISTLSFRRTE